MTRPLTWLIKCCSILQGDAVEIMIITRDGMGDKWAPKIERQILELKKD